MPNKFAEALQDTKKEGLTAGTPTPSSPHSRPSRTNAKHVGGYFEPQVAKQLRQIAVDEDTSMQALLAEALDMLFHSRHKPTIARRPEAIQP